MEMEIRNAQSAIIENLFSDEGKSWKIRTASSAILSNLINAICPSGGSLKFTSDDLERFQTFLSPSVAYEICNGHATGMMHFPFTQAILHMFTENDEMQTCACSLIPDDANLSNPTGNIIIPVVCGVSDGAANGMYSKLEAWAAHPLFKYSDGVDMAYELMIRASLDELAILTEELTDKAVKIIATERGLEGNLVEDVDYDLMISPVVNIKHVASGIITCSSALVFNMKFNAMPDLDIRPVIITIDYVVLAPFFMDEPSDLDTFYEYFNNTMLKILNNASFNVENLGEPKEDKLAFLDMVDNIGWQHLIYNQGSEMLNLSYRALCKEVLNSEDYETFYVVAEDIDDNYNMSEEDIIEYFCDHDSGFYEDIDDDMDIGW